MLARVSAGNSGIREYLEYGMKQGREFSRNELDERVVLDGDLSVTDALINQIEDKGQERYLHITLSFRERDVDEKILSAVTEEYKSLLMAAYGRDEYNFYAEAHLPKTQTVLDKKTGKFLERKPHIHIVIPKINSLTGNVLNPVGKYTAIEKYHDAIQEYINKKYNLESPKDFVREGDNHYAEVISRIKGDVYGEKKNDIQKTLADTIERNDIRDFSEFKKVASCLGEVRVRNAGKPNEYLALKVAGADKFTNLKSPLFSKEYIELRKIKSSMPTEKQISERVNNWKATVSKEIKLVYSATPAFRDKYYGASKEEQKNLLNDRESVYEQKYRGNEHQRTARRQSNNQPRINDLGRKNIAGYTYGLSGLPKRGLVYGIRGNEPYAEKTERVLSDNEQRALADERREKPEYSGLRRSGHYGQSEGGGRAVASSLPAQALKSALSHDEQVRERLAFTEIRRHLKPERLLSVLKEEYGLLPERHTVTFARDGSARISAGNQNLNVSDFLTKHMNIPWNDAREILKSCYAEQKLDAQLVKADRSIQRDVRQQKAESWTLYQRDKNDIWMRRVSPPERQAALSVALFERLQREELIRESAQQRMSQFAVNNNQSVESENMGLSDAFKGHVSSENNGFVSTDNSISIKDNVAKIEREQEMQDKLEKRLRLNDLVAQKSPAGDVEYKSREDGKAVFKDSGDRIEFTRGQQKDENIALGLEVAIAKYGKSLRLTGSEDFRSQAIKVAAERGMDLVFTPEKYQRAFQEEKARLADVRETMANQNDKNTPAENRGSEKQHDSVQVEYRKMPNQYDEKFSLLVNGKPAADVLQSRPELVDVLQKNGHLKQFSREELLSGTLDHAGKGRAKDDVLDMNGNSMKSAINEHEPSEKETQNRKMKM